MNRRVFLASTVAAAAPLILKASPSRDEKLRRVGMNTIIFRMRFPGTRVEGHPITEPKLTLFDVPEYYADRFKLHNLEFWSRHFEVHTPGYLSDLKKAIAKTRSTLVNIQLDDQPWQEGKLGGYFLASRSEGMRRDSLRFVKEWIDAAAFLGSQAIRINTESGDFNLCLDSFCQITEYAAGKGVVILVENHGGIAADPDLHVRLIKEVRHSNIRTAPDFGNHKPEIRYEALRKIMPYAWEVEPKALPFNEKFEHTGYDFGRCMRIAVDSGFKGVYSVDYWDREAKPAQYEKIADWLIEHVLEYL
jgi:sugar phosphate isomerase/epimerase